jgi:replicative DNA helicase
MILAEQITSLFRGRHDVLAVPNGPGFKPQPLDGPIKPSWIAKDHLGGKRCFGFYLMTATSQVYCSAVDFDNKPETPDPEWQVKAESVYFELVKYGLAPLVEVSQSGNAAHVWLFFDTAIDAWLVRQFWKAIEQSSSVPFVEVYPRQDELSGKGLGNLIRYPLWNQSRFVDVENEWATIDPEVALGSVRRVDETTLRTVIFHASGVSPRKVEQGVVESGLSARVDRLVSREHTLLGRRWRGDMEGLQDKSRSALLLSIACELVRLYLPTVEIEQAIVRWCAQNGYDKGERADWVTTTIAKAYEFIGTRQTERLATSGTMQDAALSYLEKIKNGAPRCIPSGIRELDYAIDGVAPGEVCVIAARPSHGKTAFAMQWVDIAAADGVPSLIISEEMTRQELGKRALLSISHLSEEVWASKFAEMRGAVATHYKDRAPVHVVDSCQTIAEVERQVDEHCQLYDVKLVAVDYLQLLGSDHTTRYDSVSEISRRLKQTATRNQVAMLVLCQLNREVEKRDGHDPKLSDLRESGQIEQDADLVLMLQWPMRHDLKADAQLYKVFCAKRRNGPIRTSVVFTEFHPSRQRFGMFDNDEF